MATATKEQEQVIKIPRRELVDGKEFYTPELIEALRDCQSQDYEAQFMPAIIDARIDSPKEERIWQTWFSAPSIRATGRTKQGNPVVVYAHIPNHFSSPDNIKKAREQGLRNGAGVMPQTKFQRLLDLNELTDNQGNRLVWSVDYNTLKNSTSDVIPLKDALKHPQTIPFVGGEERAQRYLEKHKEVYGDKIGIWHSDDLSDEPRGRLLFVGYGYGGGLNGGDLLGGIGRFVGVCKTGEASSREIRPTKQQIQKIIAEFTAPCNEKELEQRIDALL